MLYRTATALAARVAEMGRPLAGPDLRERLSLDTPKARSAGAIWLHAASVGEVNSAAHIARALAAQRSVIVTTNTLTGRAAARDLGLDACLAPFDAVRVLRRFLNHVRPALALTVENELWPNRIAELHRSGVPQAVIGARLSERSARRWSRMGGVTRAMLGAIDLLSAQDPESEARLLQLGLRPEALAPRLNMKLLAPATRPLAPPVPGREAVWLAASTHEGEEAAILAAHAALRQADSALRLILAPRHPRRATEVAGLIAAAGLTFDRLGDSPVAISDAPVLLVDRLGVMDDCYAAAALCLTGGSLVDRGGHTPWEPAAHGCALMHGPHVANFARDYALLDGAGAAVEVTGDSLAQRIGHLLADPAQLAAMGTRARAVLRAEAPDPAPLIARLLALADR